LNAKFGDGYPKLRELQSQIASVNSAIDAEGRNIGTRLANEYDAAAKAEAMIRDDFEKQKSEAYKLDENVAQYSILKHQVESGQQLYDTLQLKLKEANVTSGLTSSYVSVVDRAELPDKPVEPRKTLNLALGLGGGLFGGLILGLVLDSFDDTMQTSEEIETVTALPELGCIPFLAGLARKDHKRLSPTNLLGVGSGFGPISVREPDSPGAEAYRALCSVILLSSIDNPPKILVVTSAMPGEGKSTVSCNLATALAQRGLRILLVDADLRCSSIHTQLGRMPGLSTILASEPVPYRRHRPFADLPNLEVIPAGFRPSDPTEMLASARMQLLMADWSAQYDHVIVDTPPVLPFADSLALSARADGVILVARSGVSRSKALLRARDVLSRSGANILGVVLNAVRRPEYYYAYPQEYKRLSSSNDLSRSIDTKKAKAAGAS
jgi:capsular exopolysaccharide synthesis family protein